MQVVMVYLQLFRRNSRLKCALQPKIAKKLTKPLFWGSRSFRVIDVDKTNKTFELMLTIVRENV